MRAGEERRHWNIEFAPLLGDQDAASFPSGKQDEQEQAEHQRHPAAVEQFRSQFKLKNINSSSRKTSNAVNRRAELMLFSSNLTKLFHGGWMPLVFGLFLFVLLSTWKRGSVLVASSGANSIFQWWCSSPHASEIPRVAGTAVDLTADPTMVPSALFHNLQHFKVLHERTLFLHVVTADVRTFSGRSA